ncbi:unnamed protein product [Adineta steineri]|uniref:Neurotransmitter-gated ion-channel ligand-binding domain-containing protein n=1 Tax=Adineta steineri TaxID=433720 RepID=A0A813ZUG1_9BILA|nr:unnamed protein product [Adineta steineri]
MLRSTNKVQTVYVRLMFLRIGEIDTLNEKYQAQASIEARWQVEFDKLLSSLSPEDQKRLADGKSVSLLKYAESHWTPQLYIENTIGDLKEQIRYTAKKSKEDNQIYVCEHRDIKGVFWEKLELQHFPTDVQDLSISIGSMLYNDRVILVVDPYHGSGVNREAFVDQQEWKLYAYVDTLQRYVTEFLFRDTDDEEDESNQIENINNKEDRKRSILTVTCHAANRIQTSCTLLLTSITFRWTVNRSLPTISYLTSMDKYAILCMGTLAILCLWHAVVGAYIFLHTPDFRLTPDMDIAFVDQWVFIIAIGIFLFIHLVLLTWLYYVPLKCHRQMEKKEDEYRHSIHNAKKNLKYIPISM